MDTTVQCNSRDTIITAVSVRIKRKPESFLCSSKRTDTTSHRRRGKKVKVFLKNIALVRERDGCQCGEKQFMLCSGQTASSSSIPSGGTINTSSGLSRVGGGRKLHNSALKVTVKRNYKLLFFKKLEFSR